MENSFKHNMVSTRNRKKQGSVVCSSAKQSKPPGPEVNSSGTTSDAGACDVPGETNSINNFNLLPCSVVVKDIYTLNGRKNT